MVLKDDLIAQSPALIPKDYQSGFLALLAKFNFAIPCNDNYVFVHCLLPKELYTTAEEATASSASNSSNISKIYKGISNSFAEMIEKLKSKLSEYHDAKLATHRKMSLLDDNSITEDILHQSPHRQPSDEGNRCARQFPHFNILDSASFETSVNLSSPSQNSEKEWLQTTDFTPVLHPPLRRVWLASFIPDGFWPQLLPKIILDDTIFSTLSTILSMVLQNSEYSLNLTDPKAISLWELSQLGLAVVYDGIKLVELVQTTSPCDSSSDKYNLSQKYPYQIELTIHVRDIALVHNQNSVNTQDSKMNVIRLATRVLVLIEQHILDIGEEWFPGTISDTRNKQILSFVPCPTCIDKNDDDTLYTDCVGRCILHYGDHKVVCFSFKELLVAHALPSRCVTCPLHEDMLVQQLAPDMVNAMSC